MHEGSGTNGQGQDFLRQQDFLRRRVQAPMSDQLADRRTKELAQNDLAMRRLFMSLGMRQSVLDKAIKHSEKVIRAARPLLATKLRSEFTH